MKKKNKPLLLLPPTIETQKLMRPLFFSDDWWSFHCERIGSNFCNVFHSFSIPFSPFLFPVYYYESPLGLKKEKGRTERWKLYKEKTMSSDVSFVSLMSIKIEFYRLVDIFCVTYNIIYLVVTNLIPKLKYHELPLIFQFPCSQRKNNAYARTRTKGWNKIIKSTTEV